MSKKQQKKTKKITDVWFYPSYWPVHMTTSTNPDNSHSKSPNFLSLCYSPFTISKSCIQLQVVDPPIWLVVAKPRRNPRRNSCKIALNPPCLERNQFTVNRNNFEFPVWLQIFILAKTYQLSWEEGINLFMVTGSKRQFQQLSYDIWLKVKPRSVNNLHMVFGPNQHVVRI